MARENIAQNAVEQAHPISMQYSEHPAERVLEQAIVRNAMEQAMLEFRVPYLNRKFRVYSSNGKKSLLLYG
jgi:hypothetical protein